MRSKAIYTLLPTLLICLLLSASLTMSADALHPKKTYKNSFSLDKAPVFNNVGADRGFGSAPKGTEQTNLRLDPPPTPLSPGLVAGWTTYDYQHNGSMGDQIAFSYVNNWVHMVWMAQTNFAIGPGVGDRHIRYARFDAPNSDYPHDASGVQVTVDYSGYTNVAVEPAGGASVSCHVNPASTGWKSAVYYDEIAGFAIFTDNDIGSVLHEWTIVPPGDPTPEHLWPQHAIHSGDSSGVTNTVAYVLNHSFANENLHLYRRVLNSGTGIWAPWDYRLIDDVVTDLSYIITPDVNTDKVAVVYSDDRFGLGDGDGGQTDLDIYYKISTDQGDTWGSQINVSNYHETDSLWRGYSDIDALFTSDGELHIIWAAREILSSTQYYNYRARLIHWSTDNTTQGIIDEARYDVELNGDLCDADAWNLYIAKMSISECDGKLYAIYTKFGDAKEPDALRDCSQLSFANGELYQAGSDDFGATWDTAWNLTKTRNLVPGVGCDSNECESDHWSSAAPFGMVYAGADDTLDLLYINDRDAGGIPQGSGTWTNNNVMHLRIACRTIVHLPKVSLEPNSISDPAHTAPGVPYLVDLKLANIGNAAMTVNSITPIYDDVSGWITIGAYDGTVAAGSFTTVPLTLNPPATPDPAGYYGRLLFSTNSPSGVDTVEIALLVAGDFDEPTYDTLHTTTKALVISNTGNIGHNGQDSVSFNIPLDCDDTLSTPNGDMYLYDLSPVIAWNDGAENLAYTTMFTQLFIEDGTYRPQSPMYITDEGTYTMAVCTVTTTDSLYGVAVTLYAPTNGDDFLVGQYDFWAWNPTKLNSEVYVGVITDWDIPADIGVNNGSGFDAVSQTIWQRGAESDIFDDTLDLACVIKEDDRFGGMRQLTGTTFGAWTNENAPMQTGAGYDEDSLYAHMSNATWYNSITVDTANHDSELVDLHAGMTFGQVDMSGATVHSFVWAIATTNLDSLDMITQLDAAQAWADAQGLLEQPCDCLPGDANEDGGQNVGDAVYLINFVFKSGPAPLPYGVCSGDANGDCGANVGDAVYLINFVFKSGPAPKTCDFWRDLGGQAGTGCGALQ